MSKLKCWKSIILYDVQSEELLSETSEKQEYWLVIDGYKRLKSLLQCYNNTGDSEYLTLDAIVEDINNIPEGDIIKYMIDQNYMASRWTAKDYVESAYQRSPSNPIFQMAHLLMSLGAPIATVSRFSTAHPNTFSIPAIVDYQNGNLLAVSLVTYTRALELYRLFVEVGFSPVFINRRYLIDYVNTYSYIYGFQNVINRIASIDKATVELIYTKTPQEYESGVIATILDKHYADCKKIGTE